MYEDYVFMPFFLVPSSRESFVKIKKIADLRGGAVIVESVIIRRFLSQPSWVYSLVVVSGMAIRMWLMLTLHIDRQMAN